MSEDISPYEQYNRVCKGEFEAINIKLDRLDEAIRGNGKLGMLVRIDRLEAAEATRSKLLWIIAGATVMLAIRSIWAMVLGVSNV